MVRHHQRPRRQRHELPRDQEREGVVGEHDQLHAGEKGRIERQHALRRRFVPAVAEREQARARGAEIDHGEEERGERIDAEMRAEPRQAERQRQAVGGRRAASRCASAAASEIGAIRQARAVDDAASPPRTSDDDRAARRVRASAATQASAIVSVMAPAS